MPFRFSTLFDFIVTYKVQNIICRFPDGATKKIQDRLQTTGESRDPAIPYTHAYISEASVVPVCIAVLAVPSNGLSPSRRSHPFSLLRLGPTSDSCPPA